MAQFAATMANITQRKGKDGGTSYRVQVRIAGFPAQHATFERRTDAKAWAAQTEAAIREGRHFPQREAKRHTLRELADRHLASVERRKPEALGKQKQIMGWWKDELGDYALASITPAIIAAKRDELLKDRAPATVNRYLATLGKAMQDAVREWHWLNENPVRRVSKESEPEGRVRWLSDEERGRLLEACAASPLKELELMVLLALTTGMRRGEILGLRWVDVDLKRRQAVLHKTKNRERRSVPLVQRVVQLLEAHAKVRRLDTGLVFPQPGKDRAIDPARCFERALKVAKVADFRFHDLRHTAASYLAMSGATSAEIAAVLGHKTLQMVKRYSHIGDAHTGEVVERMTRKFFGDASA